VQVYFHIVQMYVQMYCEFDIRPSLLKFAPMRTSCLHEIRTGCQDANAVNARIRTVANLLRIYIFAYSLAMGVDLVGIQEFAHAFACSANLAQKIYIFTWCKCICKCIANMVFDHLCSSLHLCEYRICTKFARGAKMQMP
jgi:hypothetical protein